MQIKPPGSTGVVPAHGSHALTSSTGGRIAGESSSAAYPTAHPASSQAPGATPRIAQKSGSDDISEVIETGWNPRSRAVAFSHMFSRQCARDCGWANGYSLRSATTIYTGADPTPGIAPAFRITGKPAGKGGSLCTELRVPLHALLDIHCHLSYMPHQYGHGGIHGRRTPPHHKEPPEIITGTAGTRRSKRGEQPGMENPPDLFIAAGFGPELPVCPAFRKDLIKDYISLDTDIAAHARSR